MQKYATRNFFIYDADSEYPGTAPYDPEDIYPEYPFGSADGRKSERNDVYRMIRELFFYNQMDAGNYNSPEWNPLGGDIKPGDTVLIKPNLVMHDNPAETDGQKKLDCLITHPSVTRCVFDYVYIALKGKGRIVIADAPVQDCRMDILLERSGYGKLLEYLMRHQSDQLGIEFADLRDTRLEREGGRQRQGEREDVEYRGRVVDLGDGSEFAGLKTERKFRITNYAAGDTVRHHSKGRNEYCVSEALLQADVVVNLPKPKTHRLAGHTAALKNMIGINTRKEYLPHHRKGAKDKSGDEYLGSHRLWKWLNSTGNDIKNWALKRQADALVDSMNWACRLTGRKLDRLEENRKKFGMWYGNDTIWRTILDVNKIVCFCDKSGRVCAERQRKVLHIGDMIVCGDQEGPMRPSYKKVGGILFSDSPVEFDYCVAKLMGFDYTKMPTLLNALKDSALIRETDKIRLRSNCGEFDKEVDEIGLHFGFRPSAGWIGHIELPEGTAREP